eukprot:scaffold659_cov329-Prasinococcus_capsulatus_cf.AAC.26
MQAQGLRGGPHLQEELGDNAAHAKDVHGGLQRGTLTVSRRVTRVVEALRREVAAPAAARVEEEGEVRRVVRWQVRLLEACEVCAVHAQQPLVRWSSSMEKEYDSLLVRPLRWLLLLLLLSSSYPTGRRSSRR